MGLKLTLPRMLRACVSLPKELPALLGSRTYSSRPLYSLVMVIVLAERRFREVSVRVITVV